MLYVQPPQGNWSSQHDLPHYWSMAPPTPTQSSSSNPERPPLNMRAYSIGGAVPTPLGDMDMDADCSRDGSASPVPYHHQQQQSQQQFQQQYQKPQSPLQSTSQSTPRKPSGSLPSQPSTTQSPASSSSGVYKGLDANKVAAALEVARDSPDGAQDADVSGTLESALSQIWDRVLAQPDSYVMTKGEFAVFNLYQHLFLDNPLATAARGRFWDNTHG